MSKVQHIIMFYFKNNFLLNERETFKSNKWISSFRTMSTVNNKQQRSCSFSSILFYSRNSSTNMYLRIDGALYTHSFIAWFWKICFICYIHFYLAAVYHRQTFVVLWENVRPNIKQQQKFCQIMKSFDEENPNWSLSWKAFS